MLINISKRELEEENYVRPTYQSLGKKKNVSLTKSKYNKPSYMKGFQFTVLYEIPCTESYVIEVIGKNFNGRKLVSKEEVLGKKKIHWDGMDMEKVIVESLKNK
jgi:hypothetical protein